MLGGRSGAQSGAVHDVQIDDNVVDTRLIGIHVIGGLQTPPPGTVSATGNGVSSVEVRRNVVAHAPTPGLIDYAGAKGIALTGGFGNATGNSVRSVTIQGNDVVGVQDDFSVHSNVEQGASDNLAALGLSRPTLTVTKSGAGTVASDPAGIDCGSTCMSGFDDRNDVTLTPSAAPGSSFTGWSGDCTGTGPCTVTMTPDRSVTATFEADKTLTVAKSGSGTGAVSSNPAGIACGPTCSHAYPHGTPVALTPTAAPGSTFTGWSGACTGTGTCASTMDQDRSVTATFESGRTLAVSKTGGGRGRISSSPPGIDCGATCVKQFPYGMSVTLTAAPRVSSIFSGWSGGCTGTGQCTLTMTAARLVTATFKVECVVPKLKGRKLAAAKQAIRKHHCGVGTIRRVHSARVRKRTVISQQPGPGTHLRKGRKVNLVVSKGKRRA